MSTYADRKVTWTAHKLHRQQASIWAAERARVFREEEIERLREEEIERLRTTKKKRALSASACRNYLKKRARRLYREGKAIKQIAEKLDVPYSRAYSWVSDINQIDQISHKVVEVKRLRDLGHTFKEIGEIMGCTLKTARSRYLRHPNVK